MGGCISSRRELCDVSPNIFSVVNINGDGVQLCSGQLEVTQKEITLYRSGKQPTRWSLQHLRRYGFDADLFTFEAGRRSATGEGIYAFKCPRAESIVQTLHSHIRGVAVNEENIMQNVAVNGNGNGPFNQSRSNRPIGLCSRQGNLNTQAQSGNYVIPSNRPNSTSSNSAVSTMNSSRSADMLPTEGNYLEPTPIRNTTATRLSSGIRLSSVGSGPLSPEPSPGSPNSFTILEVTQLNQPHNTYQNSNVYQEFPVKSTENNNNLVSKKLSLDIPPQEPAPAVKIVHKSSGALENSHSPPGHHTSSPKDNDASHMYVNVSPGEFDSTIRSGTPTNASTAHNNFAFPRLSSTYSVDMSNRCYENLEPGEFRPTLARTRFSKPDIFAKAEYLQGTNSDQSEPATPVSKEESRKVNYIVLDLDHSPSAASVGVNSSSGLNSTGIVTSKSSSAILNANQKNSVNNNNNNNNITKVTTPIINEGSNLLPPESPKKSALGYATIDFNKTVALSNTTASMELDAEGSRKTRHSSTATRQSNSVSD